VGCRTHVLPPCEGCATRRKLGPSGSAGSMIATCGAAENCGRNLITCTAIQCSGNSSAIRGIRRGAVGRITNKAMRVLCALTSWRKEKQPQDPGTNSEPGAPFASLYFHGSYSTNTVSASSMARNGDPKTQVRTANLGHPSRFFTFTEVIRRIHYPRLPWQETATPRPRYKHRTWGTRIKAYGGCHRAGGVGELA
jgi:hypothetical protein